MPETIDAERPTMSPPYLTQVELAVRWRISPRTLERWRWAGDGPRFIKIGGLVRYRFEDIEAFEQQQLRQITGTQQPELMSAERIAPPVRSRRKKSTYAGLTLLFAQRAQVGFAVIRCNSLNYAILR
jgi:Helix-turn-helix domain